MIGRNGIPRVRVSRRLLKYHQVGFANERREVIVTLTTMALLLGLGTASAADDVPVMPTIDPDGPVVLPDEARSWDTKQGRGAWDTLLWVPRAALIVPRALLFRAVFPWQPHDTASVLRASDSNPDTGTNAARVTRT